MTTGGRRGRGEGGIHRRPDGRWEARVSLGWREGKRDRRSVYGRTRQEVATKLRKLQRQTDEGILPGDGRTTVETWLARWLKLQEQAGKAENTLAQYEWAINKHLVPAIGKKRLVQLKADDVDDMLAARTADGMARQSLIRVRIVLKMALDVAVRRDMVVRNVAALTDPPAGPEGEGRSLTVEQAKAVLKAAKGDRFEAAYVSMLMLGLRPGEALGLPWARVDLDSGLIDVFEALKVIRGRRLERGPLKTAGRGIARRTVLAPAPLLEILKAHRKRQLEDRLKAGPLWEDSGLVFTTQFGTPIDPRNFRRSFGRLTAGIEIVDPATGEKVSLGHWHPNELRHSTVSLLSAMGVSEEDIADVVGHKTTRMTHEVYRHRVNPAVTAAQEAMERLFGSA